MLDILVQDWRNRAADKHFSRRLLYGLRASREALPPTACAATASLSVPFCPMFDFGPAGICITELRIR